MDTKLEIDTLTLRDWLNTGKRVNVLDIRPSKERAEWHIPGSTHVDAYDELKANKSEVLQDVFPDRSTPVVTVCAGGKTSLIAAKILQKAGYETYSLHGGMKAWSLSWNTARNTFRGFDIIQFRRTGKGCLSYLIVSNHEAMVIDASLPVEVYLEYLEKEKLTLKHIVDTHIHADHLTRSKQLADLFKLLPGLPENDKVTYQYQPIKDNTTITIGEAQVTAMHTPGHTAESTSYLVGGKVLLTGDTLFTNGVGRPDLKADQQEAIKKAKLLYHSLKQLLRLEPQTLVMPGHTSQPVPFDGKPIQTTLYEVSKHVPLLHMTEEEFTKTILQRIPPTPSNYLAIVEKNLQGDALDLNAVDLEAGANRCAIS